MIDQDVAFTAITLGVVEDTDDPQQWDRLKIRCYSFGDRPDDPVENLPWAMSCSPYAGAVGTSEFKRGPNDSSSNGFVSYGFRGVPKRGALALVTCLDGDPTSRVWLGCIQMHSAGHTMPHGRFSYASGQGKPDGPMTSTEQPLQPLYDNLHTAFGSATGNFEWRTRAADNSVAAVTKQILDNNPNIVSKKSDDEAVSFTEEDGNSIVNTAGYQQSRFDSESQKHDPQTYNWNTPGGHSIAMDDSARSGRIRIRTTAGHQIIMDDTNERIYINTCEGRNWIEIDQDGNIDIFAAKKISMRSETDINITAGQTIRMYAEEGIHMHSNALYQTVKNDVHVKAEGNIRMEADSNVYVQSKTLHAKVSDGIKLDGGSIDVKSSADLHLQGANVHSKATANNYVTGLGSIHLKGGAAILGSAGSVVIQGAPAMPAGDAQSASPAEASLAFYTNRVPAHEPWARTSTASDNSHAPKYSYTDPQVGREDKQRGQYWHR